jgi:acylphosphatase
VDPGETSGLALSGREVFVISEIRAFIAMTDPTTVHHLSAHFSGRVQGVGFRYSTYQVAKEFEVSGYVRNLTDGRVLLEVEGEKSEVESFLETLTDQMDGLIRETEVERMSRPRTFQGFSIR